MYNRVRDEMRPAKFNLNTTPIRPELSTVTQMLIGISQYLAGVTEHNPAENKPLYLPHTNPECYRYVKLLDNLRAS
jgi:hypothetical protein